MATTRSIARRVILRKQREIEPMNGYGTIEKMYRPLGIGEIKPKVSPPNVGASQNVVFTASAVQGGVDGFQRLVESDQVEYRIFSDDIAGVKFARDVWKK